MGELYGCLVFHLGVEGCIVCYNVEKARGFQRMIDVKGIVGKCEGLCKHQG